MPYRVSTDASGQKANIHAIIGPQQAGGLALSGHVDTVPVDGQAWTGDPFALRRRDGRLFARGSCDMKGFVAACLAAVPDFQARPLARPLHLFISYDEEVGCGGAQRLIEDMAESGLRPDLCVVGEPSGMKPILAHKGKLDLNVTVRGLTGHSSEPSKGVNAVQAAGEAIAWVAREARRLAAEGPFEDGFDPPHTTIHVGTVAGRHDPQHHPRARRVHHGMALRSPAIRRSACRADAGLDRRNIEPAMQAVHPACGFSYEIELEMPGMALPADHVLATVVKQVTGSNSTGKVSYGTEGGFYQNAGIPTIICGPGTSRRRISRTNGSLNPNSTLATASSAGWRTGCSSEPGYAMGPCTTPAPLPEFKVRFARAGHLALDRRQHRHRRLHHARLPGGPARMWRCCR